MTKKSQKFQGPRRKLQPTFAPQSLAVNTDYKDASVVVTLPFNSLHLIIAGCGGTGAYVTMHVGRLMTVMSQMADVRLTLADPDVVKEANLGRQLFYHSELGEPKALALARRFGQRWGNRTMAFVDEYNHSLLLKADLTVIVGCVDNAAARGALSDALRRNDPGRPPRVWWLDCGNLRETGRVLLGSAAEDEQMRGAFIGKNRCISLPSPVIQSPGLLISQPEEQAGAEMSCAEMAQANLQSLNINAAIAVQAADMLTRLLITKDLKRYACGVNVAAGSVKSSYTTPENVARVIGRPVHFVQSDGVAEEALAFVREIVNGGDEAAA